MSRPERRNEIMKTVADQFAETLAAAGVKRIYGIVGDSLNGLTDALRRQGKIEWVPVRHEEVAAFAAGAEAHLTGELAVCAGSCGPGNLHLINGLFDCHRSRVPVLGIAAQIPSAEIGSGYFQETRPQTLFQECSHYCELISGANQMPRVLEVAIREAVGRRGVSVVVMPGDIALQAAANAPPAQAAGLLPAIPNVTPAREDLERLAALLNGEGRITLLCGSVTLEMAKGFTLFVPQLGSQIYTMGGMTTHLNLLADKLGEYPGFSANFSGDDFSEMRFIVKAVPAGDFEAWVARVRGTGSALDDTGYAELAKPSKAVPAKTYRAVAPNLFERIVDQTASGPERAGIGAAWCPPVRKEGG
jgi:hypothetical protein